MAIGIGFSINGAVFAVLMGPLWLSSEEYQLFSRNRRVGQKCKTICFRLIGKDVRIEIGMTDPHKFRRDWDAMARDLEVEVEQARRQ
jgi:hypothetical protein